MRCIPGYRRNVDRERACDLCHQSRIFQNHLQRPAIVGQGRKELMPAERTRSLALNAEGQTVGSAISCSSLKPERAVEFLNVNWCGAEDASSLKSMLSRKA